MAHLPGISPLAVSLPTGGGDVRGLGDGFVPDLNRGTGSFAVDLDLPAGPAGLRPALALAYSSGAGNGAFGLGWALGVPTIHRDGERRFVRYDDTDTFRFDPHGELVALAGGGYRPKVDGLHARITRTDHWEVTGLDGTVQRFGVDAGARIADPDHPDRVLAWGLQETRDRHGGTVRYSYLADGGNRYLAEVAWGPYRLVLTYGPRPDVTGTARHGFPIRTALRATALDLHCDRLGADSLIRRHALQYTEPAETPISLLHRVVRSGHRGAETAALPPLTFGYTTLAPGPGRCRVLRADLGATPPPLGPGVDLLDCTGDGLPDVVALDGEQHRYWTNRGDGTFTGPRRIRSLPSGADLRAPDQSFADLDGDGAVDLLVGTSGWFPRTGPAEWGPFRRYRRGPTFDLRDPSNRLVDLDADGRVDLLRSTPSAFVLHLNRGTDGWEALPPVPRIRDLDAFPDVSLADPRVHLADMTGDGLADLVLVRSGEVSYWPYEGVGRWGRRRTLAGSPAFDRPSRPRTVLLTDVNGDGVADLVVVEGDTVRTWVNRCGAAFAPPHRVGGTPPTDGARVRLADLHGSGTPGVLWSYAEQVRPHAAYVYLDLAGAQKPYLLSSVDDGLGLTTTVAYRSSSSFAAQDRAAGRPWTTVLPFPVQVVAEVRQDDPTAGLATRMEIRYRDGLYDGRERRFAGFGGVELVEHGDALAEGLRTVVTFDATPTAGLGADDRAAAVARWGRVLQTRQERPDGTVLRTATGTWTAAVAEHAADGTPVVTVVRSATRVVTPGTTGDAVVEHAVDHDEQGNVVRDRCTGGGELDLTSEVQYARRPDGTPTPFPARVVERAGDGSVVRELRTYYDGPEFVGLPLGEATTGNAVRRSVRVLDVDAFAAHYGPQGLDAAALGYRVDDGVVWSDVARTGYDGRGNVVATRDPLGHEAAVTYDLDGLFVVGTRDAAGHVARLSWDDAALRPRVTVDVDGATTAYAFDPLGRVVAVAAPGETLDDPGVTVVHDLAARPASIEVRRRTAAGEPPTVQRSYHRGNGETLQVRTLVDAATTLVSAGQERDARGRVARLGEPTVAASLDFAPVALGATTTVHRDALGRVVAADLPGGRTTRVVHDAFAVTGYDANDTDDSPENVARGFFDTPTVRRLDGWGRPAGVVERLGGGAEVTHAYRHDLAGRLLAVTGPDGGTLLTRRLDAAGRLLVLDHRDAGRRLFFADAAGRTVRTVDAAGTRVDAAFDALGRPVTVAVDGVTVQTFGYDAPGTPHGTGRLCTVRDEAGDWAFAYDGRGRLVRRTLTDGAGSWSFDYEHRDDGQLAALRYPDGAEVTYRYDRAGRLVAVPGVLDHVAYDARGRRTGWTAANGVRTAVDYDPATAFLTRLRVVGPGGAPLHDTTTQRDAVGNVLARAGGAGSCRYTLDPRYQLLAAGDRAYGYDAAANVVRHPTHGGARIGYDPPGSNRIAGVVVDGALHRLYEHDANGHLVRLPGRELAWDGLGRLVAARRSDGAAVTYRHDARGEAVWRTTTVDGVTRRTLRLAGLYEEDDDGTVRRYVTAGGPPLVVDRAGGRTHLHADDLGRVVALTDAAGAAVGTRAYHPYGEPGPTTGPAAPAFVGGAPPDDVTGLLHLGARHYAPEIGRFVSPDPLYLGDPARGLDTPVLLNLYGYAANNPMVYTDPTGLSLLGAIFGGLVGGLVGAAALVASGGNPILAGLAGGLAGGAVSGGIDGGLRGAVIGGVFGAATGALGGAAVWGASALGGLIGSRVGDVGWYGAKLGSTVFSLLTTAGGVTAGLYQAAAHDNWEILASLGAGAVGGVIGSELAGEALMRSFYADPKRDPQVRELVRQVGQAKGVNLGKVTFEISNRADGTLDGSTEIWADYDDTRRVVTINRAKIGNDYLKFREVVVHELGHAVDHARLGPRYDAQYGLYPEGDKKLNPFERGPENFAVRTFTPFPPSPWRLQPFLGMPTTLALSRPERYEER